MRALVTGATGYVGSRLVPAPRSAVTEVLASARNLGKLSRFDLSDGVQPTRSALTPFHLVIFPAMARRIADLAEG